MHGRAEAAGGRARVCGSKQGGSTRARVWHPPSLLSLGPRQPRSLSSSLPQSRNPLGFGYWALGRRPNTSSNTLFPFNFFSNKQGITKEEQGRDAMQNGGNEWDGKVKGKCIGE